MHADRDRSAVHREMNCGSKNDACRAVSRMGPSPGMRGIGRPTLPYRLFRETFVFNATEDGGIVLSHDAAASKGTSSRDRPRPTASLNGGRSRNIGKAGEVGAGSPGMKDSNQFQIARRNARPSLPVIRTTS